MANNNQSKDLAYYMALPYTIQIRFMNDESGQYFYASVAELDGCQSSGQTYSEAYESVREAMEGHLSVKLEFGDPIPEPVGEDQFSGKFNIRVPKSLHRQLSERAAAENVSLNQYCLYKLSK
ncbi:type II toxin-antitoxin system HicB family antitoxin [Paenibacillus sp. FSL H8-0168]|uniref:type II toxin-antitoxin system HicB family antitoxin n=1 Tax=Paenibacillus sp. FSL H8-0168 TaxID=2921378 RepID=UPI0031590341